MGPPPAKDSYLNIANIISAAEYAHADAIHSDRRFFFFLWRRPSIYFMTWPPRCSR